MAYNISERLVKYIVPQIFFIRDEETAGSNPVLSIIF